MIEFHPGNGNAPWVVVIGGSLWFAYQTLDISEDNLHRLVEACAVAGIPH